MISDPYIFAILSLGNFLTIYLLGYMHNTFYKKKNWAETYPALYVLVYVLVYFLVLGANMLELPPVNLAATFLSYLVPLFLCYRVTNIRGIAYWVFYLVCILAMEIIMGASMGYLNNGMGFQTHYEVLTPQVSVIMNLVEMMLVGGICKFGNKERNNQLNKVTLIYVIMPLLSVAMILVDVYQLAAGGYVGFNSEQFLHTTLLLLCVNIALFVILEKYTSMMKRQMKLQEEMLKAASDADLMGMAARTMKERLMIAEQVLQQDRVMRHDRRHFESLMLRLLEDGRVEDVKKCLQERMDAEPAMERKFCENTTINAALSHYAAWAEKEEIPFTISANIPTTLPVDDMELAITISNLLENAIHACQRIPAEGRFIRLNARYKKQLLLSVENSCARDVTLDEEGHPYTREEGHGIGTRSVLAFAGKTGSDVSYSVADGVFCVRMIVGV